MFCCSYTWHPHTCPLIPPYNMVTFICYLKQTLYVSTLPRLWYIQVPFFTMVRNIDQYVIATLLSFPCYFSITDNFIWPLPPLQHSPCMFCPPFLIKTVFNNYLAMVILVPMQYTFYVNMYYSCSNEFIFVNLFEKNHI